MKKIHVFPSLKSLKAANKILFMFGCEIGRAFESVIERIVAAASKCIFFGKQKTAAVHLDYIKSKMLHSPF
ncbi:hypothetical protein Q4O60_07165 [Aeribacillus pallidus]|nr:hypothetical protein [Aeribacillus pallidus]